MIIRFESVEHTLGNNHFYYDFQTDSSITGVFGHSGAGKQPYSIYYLGLIHQKKAK